ncbi:thiamine pyrophosphate-binding protein [Gordonia sp. TBRC 11910]|uniref:acetolactate synthase n=1 Tax=Gordonia asplenii TaxID=2725283 RepID=A0A848L2Z1_9ACTN|nr:thiamine pyrophosphate-binding protein [Gordonia asplenii]NMO05136.1 thiamine pyrophosphate-binding protein [Gordonia asplenii]
MTVAEAIIEFLAEQGISGIFGVHGANSEDLFTAALRRGDITVTVAKHEFGAGAMADGASRIIGRPSCVVTTSGGAAMNIVAALAEAYESRVPLLALIGCAPTTGEGRGAFQDMVTPPVTVDAESTFRSVTGFTAKVGSVDDLGSALHAAFDALRRGLPAAILLPKNVQTASATAITPTEPRPHEITEVPASAIALLRSASNPVIMLGENISRALRPDDAVALASIGAVVVATPNGRDACPLSLTAGITGIMGHPSAHDAIERADLILVIGSRLSMTDRAGLDAALDRIPTVHIDCEPPLRPVTAHVPTTDLTSWITMLPKVFQSRLRPAPLAVRPLAVAQPPDVGLTCTAAIIALAPSIPLNCNIFADAGNTGAAAVHHLPIGSGNRFVVALGMGGMGWAIAAGIGAARTTGRRSVIIAGDGAFFMHGMEIHTALEYSLPVTLIVMNNNAHAMCVTREKKFFPDVASINTFGHTDIGAGLAAMFPRLDVRTATTADDAATAAAELFTSPTSTNCLVIQTDPCEIPPFATLI